MSYSKRDSHPCKTVATANQTNSNKEVGNFVPASLLASIDRFFLVSFRHSLEPNLPLHILRILRGNYCWRLDDRVDKITFSSVPSVDSEPLQQIKEGRISSQVCLDYLMDLNNGIMVSLFSSSTSSRKHLLVLKIWSTKTTSLASSPAWTSSNARLGK